MLIQIHNHGPLITATTYWDSELARAGKLFASVNAGAIRLLLPPARYGDLADMRASQYCVLSRGPWPAEHRAEGIEILFEDGSDSPYCLHLTPESFDMLPGESEPGREWTLSAWVAKEGRPHRALDKLCHWRRIDKIPCLRAWIV